MSGIKLFIFVTIFTTGCRQQNASITLPLSADKPGSIKNLEFACGYDKPVELGDLAIFPADERGIDEMKKILSYCGVSLNFQIYTAAVQNSFATIIDNKRYIIYDPRLLSARDTNSKSYWGSVSIIAHEIGHHLSLHTLYSIKERKQMELESDRFSGFVLYKMGASLAESLYAIEYGIEARPGSYYPVKKERIKFITEGWNAAMEQRYSGAVPPPILANGTREKIEFFDRELIRSEYIEADSFGIWYADYDYQFGIVTEVDPDLSSFQIQLTDSLALWENSPTSKLKTQKIYLDAVHFLEGSEMCHSCAGIFKDIMQPGRRIKFATVEAYPGAGTMMNGVHFLTYLKMIR